MQESGVLPSSEPPTHSLENGRSAEEEGQQVAPSSHQYQQPDQLLEQDQHQPHSQLIGNGFSAGYATGGLPITGFSAFVPTTAPVNPFTLDPTVAMQYQHQIQQQQVQIHQYQQQLQQYQQLQEHYHMEQQVLVPKQVQSSSASVCWLQFRFPQPMLCGL